MKILSLPDLFQIFDKRSCIASVSIGGINALRRKIVQLFEIRIHHYFFLISVFERLRPVVGINILHLRTNMFRDSRHLVYAYRFKLNKKDPHRVMAPSDPSPVVTAVHL